MKWFRYLSNMIRFMHLPKEQRRLVFYSEGKNYWPYLEGLIQEILNTSMIPVCYISSGENDPGLLLTHSRYHVFKIDEGFLRNWLFENIETDVMVMTMPDLHQYQVKRSKHKVHYIYVQHSLVSLHMVYRKGAFDYYDTIFCAGPHHIKEIRAMEAYYKLPKKNLVEHGYARLDSIIEEKKKYIKKYKVGNKLKHILIAPSWGKYGIIESGLGEQIVEQLIEHGYKVTLRPHPQTFRQAKGQIDSIVKRYINNPLFIFESHIAEQDSLHDSDIMVSDWSGAALDYAFGLNKPVVFMDVPRKINNPDYEVLGIEPFESAIRKHIGNVIDVDNITWDKCLWDNIMINSNILDNFPIFSIGRSSSVGADFIKGLL